MKIIILKEHIKRQIDEINDYEALIVLQNLLNLLDKERCLVKEHGENTTEK